MPIAYIPWQGKKANPGRSWKSGEEEEEEEPTFWMSPRDPLFFPLRTERGAKKPPFFYLRRSRQVLELCKLLLGWLLLLGGEQFACLLLLYLTSAL